MELNSIVECIDQRVLCHDLIKLKHTGPKITVQLIP